ncbi:hypothetical protein MPH_04192 [Macrophomina phaseolina MS6]|uniref:Uncharacterized protein n=1 Tax=Macrophomina phaseolina (strain MS6) TaxID=1126212 RepID=K2RUX4_MACPH|nr:hypothetical protein MPH_04192 [Macrophomina phaseolina MS6]
MTSQMLLAPDNATFFSGNCGRQSVAAERVNFRPGTARGSQPRGFPSHLKSDLCWKPDDFKGQAEEYILRFDEEDIAAIEEAVTDFKSRCRSSSWPTAVGVF